MRMNNHVLKRSRLTSALLAALMVPVAGGAFAQDTSTTADEEEAQATDEAAQELDRVIVTGSRIARAGFDTLEPATVVTREAIEAQGITNIADALNRTPGFAGSLTPDGGQSGFNVGTNFVNRFNLGTNRTLTLVNGRRFVSSNPATQFSGVAAGLQVDLNTIPVNMIERIENVAIGGAPTYGSDAISGVVNVILRRDFEGTVFNFGYGLTEQGDNERVNFSSLIGANFGENDRGNVTFSLAYDTVDGVLGTERDVFTRNIVNTTNPLASTVLPGRTPANDGRVDPNTPFNTGNSDGIPNTVLIRDRRLHALTPGGVLLNPAGTYQAGTGNSVLRGFGPTGNVYLQFDPNGNLVPYNQGIPFNLQNASGGDGWNLAEHQQVTSDLERMTLNLNSRWAVTDNVDVFMEGLYYSAKARELIDQTPFQSTLFGGTSGSLRIDSTHPLLTPQARGVLAANGINNFNIGRASRDLYTNDARSTTDVGRFVFGLDGSFTLANRDFYWEASSNYGRSESLNYGTGLNQQRFVNAINVSVNGAGQVVCDPNARNAVYATGLGFAGGPSPVSDPNCVPLDLFGEGRPSAAALRYLTYPTVARSLLEQQVFNVNVASTLVELWSGPLQYNVGFERRTESGQFDPDANLRAGIGRSVPIAPLRGQYSTKERFAELLIPLVNPDSDLLLLKKLDVTAKYRHVDNEINGEFEAFTYGLQWKPIDDLEVRGNFTRSLRAPAITELFIPVGSAFSTVPDPCDSRNITGGTKPETRAANCAAFLSFYGLPPSGFTSVAVGATIPITTGGNPNLLNEAAESYSYGFTWAPTFGALDGFVFAADYYNIDISGIIANLNTTAIAQGCFDNDNFNAADIPNANNFCSFITRGPDGQITTVQTGFVNGAFTRLEAYSAEMRYGFDTNAMGRFNFGLSAYFPTEYTSSVNNVTTTDFGSTLGVQRSYQFDTSWQYNKVGANLAVYHTPKTQFSNTQTVETRETLFVDKYWLVNGGLSYRFNDKAIARLAVTNLLDEEPPFPLTADGYDNLGRRYNLSYQLSF